MGHYFFCQAFTTVKVQYIAKSETLYLTQIKSGAIKTCTNCLSNFREKEMRVREKPNRRKEFISKSHNQIGFILEVKRKVLAHTQRLRKYGLM